MTDFTIAVEGTLDEVIIRRVLAHCGHSVNRVFGRSGKQYLLQKAKAYSEAAVHSPWLMLVDLDHDECPPSLVGSTLAGCPSGLVFRVAVREVEAWLLADAAAVASLLGISQRLLPVDPETLDDPKQTLINLARGSRFRRIRGDIVPRTNSGRSEGPAYTSCLSTFVTEAWDVRVAAASAPSLRRCISALQIP